MAELSESVQALQREFTAARQAFDHAHFSSTAHQEQVVSNAKQLIPAAVAQCVAQGAGQAATQMLHEQLLLQVGPAAGVTWGEVIDHALRQVGQSPNPTGYVPPSDPQGPTGAIGADLPAPYYADPNFAGPSTFFPLPADGNGQQVLGHVPDQQPTASSPWVPAGSEASAVGSNKASNRKNGVVLGIIALVAVLILGGATYGIVNLLNGPDSSNSAKSQNGGSSKTDPNVTPDPKNSAGPNANGSGPSVPQDATGDVAVWGTRLYLANAQTQPLLPGNPDRYAPAWMPDLTDVQDITFGRNSGYALMADGTVRAWGSNVNGVLGVSGNDNDHSLVEINGLTDVVQVLSSAETTYALLADGTVKSWGLNREGQLGDGSDVKFSEIPVPVKGLSGVKELSISDNAAYALMADGTVMAWGANDQGQLGAGANVFRSNVPVHVAGLEGVTSVSAGYNSAFAVLEDGTVQGWGENYFSKPGGSQGYIPFHDVPVVVEGLTDVRTVVAGRRTVYGILNDGTVTVLGSREYGATGDGKEDWDFATAQTIPEVSNVKDLIVGRKAILALLNDGTVMSWGANDYGLLGQGSKNEDKIMKPQFIQELSGVQGIALGYDTAHATLADGTVLSWGTKASMDSTTKSYDELVTKPENISGLTGVRTMYASDAGFYVIVPKN